MVKLILIFLFSLLGGSAISQTKQGYIDYKTVVKTFPQDTVTIKLLTKQLNDSLQVLAAAYQKCFENVPNFHFKGAEEKFNANIKLHENAIKVFADSAELMLIKKQESIDSDIRTKTMALAQQYCISKNISNLADKQSIIYCSNCIDYTNEFIEYIHLQR